MAEIDKVIADYLDTSEEANPRVIAARVLMQLDAEQREAALNTCLSDRVRIVIGRQRMTSRHEAAANSKPGTSKWERYAREIDQRVCPGKEWKLLGDCTANDLALLANQAERDAEKQMAMAERYRRHAALIRKCGVSTLRECFTNLGEAAA